MGMRVVVKHNKQYAVNSVINRVVSTVVGGK